MNTEIKMTFSREKKKEGEEEEYLVPILKIEKYLLLLDLVTKDMMGILEIMNISLVHLPNNHIECSLTHTI